MQEAGSQQFEFLVVTTPRAKPVTIERLICARYLDAQFTYEAGQMKIVLCLSPGWRMKPSPEGDEGFFGDLFEQHIIGPWRKFSRALGSQDWQRA